MGKSTVSYPTSSSVKTLLNGLFDYAGLFPPASLSLPDAFAEYLGHRSEPDSWMTGPFVIPVGKLNQLGPLIKNSTIDGRILLDVLPRMAATVEDFVESLTEDLEGCKQFLADYSEFAAIDSFEFRFPQGLFSEPTLAAQTVSKISRLFEQAGFSSSMLFGEIVRTKDFASEVAPYFLTLSSLDARPKILGKIRCGGMSESDFPSSEDLSTFIHTAVQLNYPFKATAGLHHPIRHFNEGQNVSMHGFINLFFAVSLARVHNLKPAIIKEIVEDENPESFIFDKAGISWNGLKASNTDFIKDRKSLALSIGSCSFNEPRADLFELGWLKPSI